MVSQTLSANRTEMASDVPSLLAKIDEMRLMLETNGARGEEDRNVLQESVDALEAVGAFRVTQPKKYGGFQGRSQDHVDVARAVGRGDGGTGWITALINMAGWLTALMPEKAQDDVWAEDPNTKVTVVLATNGSTKRVPGGYIVSATHAVDDPALDALAASYLRAAPERVLWGSDWPHATASAGMHTLPDDALQIDTLARWCAVVDAGALRRVLVTNPAALYGFAPVSTSSTSNLV